MDENFGEPSVDANLEELMAQLTTGRKSLKSAPIGSSKYPSIEKVIAAIESHPLEINDRVKLHLLEVDIMPLIEHEGKYYFGVMYEASSPGSTRAPGDITVNLEGKLFAVIPKFTYDNTRLIMLRKEEYQKLYGIVQGGPVTPMPQDRKEKVQQVKLDPMHKLLYMVVSTAIKNRAADIHFERLKDGTRVRYRIDGALVVYDEAMSPDVMKRLIAATKTLAEVNSYDPLDPQDGVVTFKPEVVEQFPDLRGYSLRLSTVPIKCDAGTKEVDKMVLRLHEAEIGRHSLRELGFPSEMVEQIYGITSASQGLMLVTGPTGSGKTTTLYSILDHLNTPDRNLLTIEDPIEAFIKGLNQSQVNKERGWTFAKVMRHYLRQDPNVILVGEARDQETIDLLFKAAETGHFVFSTVHTNSAYETLTRIFNLGIAPTYVVSSLSAVLSQRLAKVLCTECKQEYDAGEELSGLFRTKIKSLPLWKAVGCDKCNSTGYHGRIAVPELWVIDDEARDMIAAGETYVSKYVQAAMKNGAKTLMQNGLELVLSGQTSLQEIARFARGGLFSEKKHLMPIIQQYANR